MGSSENQVARKISLRSLAFIAIMGTLGNILFFLSQSVFKMAQVALDLSHIGTLIASIYGGPVIGLTVGLIVGLSPGFYFGPAGGLGFLGLLGLPIGKALTGFTAGMFARLLRIHQRRCGSMLTVVVVLLGYIPESIFTIFFFRALVPIFLPSMTEYLIAFLIPILIKAWIEVTLIGFFVGALSGNDGFTRYMRQMLSPPITPIRQSGNIK